MINKALLLPILFIAHIFTASAEPTLLPLAEFVAAKQYQQTKFTRYKRARRKEERKKR